jgi:hypothetical protein
MYSSCQTIRGPGSRRKSAWRFLWVALLVLHAPATIKVFSVALGGGSDWSSAVLMAATNAFFVLEIFFGWSLHLLSDRRSALVFLLVVALLHAGVIDRAMPDVLGEEGVRMVLLFTAGSAVLVRLALAGLSIFVRLADDAAAYGYLLRRRAYSTVPPPSRSPVSPRMLSRMRPLRAPPV